MLSIQTPVIESPNMSSHIGCPVYLKLDLIQPSGSFKIRGLGLAASRAKERGYSSLISSSGGNAGKAVAYAGRKLGMPVTVVVPESTPPLMRDKIAEEGANVIVHGRFWAEADQLARKLLEENPKAAYMHPFDHPDVWEGNSSMAKELPAQMSKPGAIVTVCGGGGLLAGLCQGLDEVGWGDIPIFCVETEGAASLGLAVKMGKPARLETINTLAATLAASQVCEAAFKSTQTHKVITATVTDRMAMDACIRFANEHRFLVELACGAGIAAIYEKLPGLLELKPSSILLIICGGSAISSDMLQSWKRQEQA
eukprot:TRINITY_DN836_c0_g2_i1.p1 TRINITY_DN836_c0_g2~~TRINITY_DN836_c0_g2_i1.p1  ORF type:complete len:311 (-),score=72.81 TRINITY_DN836_c0_g2_i1:82-1014(-)